MTDRPNPLVQLTLWRIREFTREPEALFWVFAFPIVLAFALGLAFKSRGTQVVRIGVEAGVGAEALAQTLDAAPKVEARLYGATEAGNRLRTGRVALVVVPGDPVVFRYDSTRQESMMARLIVDDVLQAASGRREMRAVRDERITEPGARYIDFLIPGLLGMNIMGTGMWGVGFGIVKSRNQKLLKRLLASPMKRRHFMLSHMLARLVFLTLEVVSLLLFASLVFGVPFRGSVAAVAVVVVVGALSFSGLGLLVASRAQTVEGVSGLMNLVMVPMWIGSGVFFAYSNFPEPMQPFLKALPLTELNDALRAVIIDGSSLAHVGGLVAALGAWAVVTFGVALRIFRWQ
jgi:ABC-type multidrug transport system permease subunit